MQTLKLGLYVVSIALIGIAVSLATKPNWPVAMVSFALIQLTFIGWRNIWPAILNGIYADDNDTEQPTE